MEGSEMNMKKTFVVFNTVTGEISSCEEEIGKDLIRETEWHEIKRSNIRPNEFERLYNAKLSGK